MKKLLHLSRVPSLILALLVTPMSFGLVGCEAEVADNDDDVETEATEDIEGEENEVVD